MNNRVHDNRVIVMYMREGWTASSSYYRLLQYANNLSRELDFEVLVRILVPDSVVKMRYDAAGGKVSLPKTLLSKVLYNLSVYLHGIPWMLNDVRRQPDCLIVLRSLFPKYCRFPINKAYSLLLSSCKGVVWDFDDDIFDNKEISSAEASLLIGYSDRITVTHAGLRELLPPKDREKVRLLATTDGDVRSIGRDIEQERAYSYSSEIRLVWVASASSLPFLTHIADALDEAANAVWTKLHKKLKLRVVCNKPLERQFNHLEVEFIEWSRKAAIDELKTSHIGIMPLDDTRFARGKGSFKIIQYMGAGLPSIASSVGFNKQVIVDGETGYLVGCSEDWIEAILRLSEDRSFWNTMSGDARKRWEAEYSYNANLAALAGTISEAIQRG